MGIVYRYKKQEPLTIEEMDGNFANLDERIKQSERLDEIKLKHDW